MKIKPLADRVVIKLVEEEETSKGGLILTGSATSKYSGTEVKVDGEECTIVRQSDILAIVE